MKIHAFEAHQFRNFDHINYTVLPSAPLVAIIAPNASGKTNVLELLVVMLRGRSFRSSLDDCVQWGAQQCVVKGEMDVDGQIKRLAVQYRRDVKKVRIEEDGAPVSPVTFFGKYPHVLFVPEDAFLFNRGPSGRRNFLNSSLAGSNEYLSVLVQYHKVLKQRNAGLKYAQGSGDIDAWTSLLVEYARIVWNHRQEYVRYLHEHVARLYEELFFEKKEIVVDLVLGAPSVDSLPDILRESWVYEKKYKYTMYGPHRDDIVITVDGRPVDAVFSRGQLRGLVIAMKVVARDYIERQIGISPILLFDEILSELDPMRQESLLSHLPPHQTILTCTSIPDSIRLKSDVAIMDIQSLIASPVHV